MLHLLALMFLVSKVVSIFNKYVKELVTLKPSEAKLSVMFNPSGAETGFTRYE